MREELAEHCDLRDVNFCSSADLVVDALRGEHGHLPAGLEVPFGAKRASAVVERFAVWFDPRLCVPRIGEGLRDDVDGEHGVDALVVDDGGHMIGEELHVCDGYVVSESVSGDCSEDEEGVVAQRRPVARGNVEDSLVRSVNNEPGVPGIRELPGQVFEKRGKDVVGLCSLGFHGLDDNSRDLFCLLVALEAKLVCDCRWHGHVERSEVKKTERWSGEWEERGRMPFQAVTKYRFYRVLDFLSCCK